VNRLNLYSHNRILSYWKAGYDLITSISVVVIQEQRRVTLLLQRRRRRRHHLPVRLHLAGAASANNTDAQITYPIGDMRTTRPTIISQKQSK
jgi:hypothetical protein